MTIVETRLYIQEGEPETRSARTAGFTEKVPPGLSGLFTRNTPYEEALQVGRELERQNYTWLEEPLQDHGLAGLKKLCDRLDLPILAMEWVGYIGGQPFSAAPYLADGAVDIVRQRGIGITGQLKLAQLCESFGVEVHGGNPHVTLAIGNDPLYEAGRAMPLAAAAYHRLENSLPATDLPGLEALTSSLDLPIYIDGVFTD